MMLRTVCGFAIATAVLASPVEARMGGGGGGGGSSYGESWYSDMVRNPRLIEPYAHLDPSRYRVSHPREGWDDRQVAAAARRGYNVRVRPYRYYYGY